ncbi:MAG TPA: thiamine pyrophosphate-dependent enzyme, partial [Candidatus Angelobacter sp.]|nr:thiamine pyrophosphate-dependent enzyme [Candidatus Angelobacter sp.]
MALPSWDLMPSKKKKQLKVAPKRRKAKRTKSKPSGAASKGSKAKTVVAAVLDSHKLQSLYATMLKTQMLNQRAGEILSAQQKDNITAGREAVLVGAIAHALAGDSIAVRHNGLLASFIRGTPLKSIFEQIIPINQQSSDSTANQNGMDSSSQSTLAQGMALASEIKETSNVVLVFSGEFSADRAAHYESLALAAQSKLPLVCLAEITDIEEHHTSHPSTKGAAHFPRIAVDGNDVVAVFRVAQEAVRRARAGHGPSLIECVMPEHAPGHVTAGKVAEEARDPLAFM